MHFAASLSGLAGVQPASNYTIRTDEEMHDTLSVAGSRQTGCTMVIHLGGAVEYAAIDAQDLREALAHDADQSIGPSPSDTASRNHRARALLRRGGRA